MSRQTYLHLNFLKIYCTYKKFPFGAAVRDNLFLMQLEKHLMRQNLHTAVIHYESLDYHVQCRCNRPLNVLLSRIQTFLLVCTSSIKSAHI